MRYLLLLPILGFLLAACATISEDQCRRGDWEGIGFSDGTDGRASDYIENHAEACASVGVQPDQARWLAGREQGLRYFCTPLKAYIEGRRGVIFKNVCPASVQPILRRENRRGISARTQLLDRRRDRLFIVVNPGLLRLPRPVLQPENGIDEYDIYRNEILRLRTDRWFY